jgi:hypothetical protein
MASSFFTTSSLYGLRLWQHLAHGGNFIRGEGFQRSRFHISLRAYCQGESCCHFIAWAFADSDVVIFSHDQVYADHLAAHILVQFCGLFDSSGCVTYFLNGMLPGMSYSSRLSSLQRPSQDFSPRYRARWSCLANSRLPLSHTRSCAWKRCFRSPLIREKRLFGPSTASYMAF